MRLINTTSLQVEEFSSNDDVDYVILSHTWEEEEVTLQDIQSGAAISKKGYAKITSCCQKAARDGFTYCWIDTCCIDKTSSAELSEAINSMYQWYQQARICYAYLADFHGTPEDVKVNHPSFAEAKWFTRGWTLQELIAPNVVEFFNACWQEIGTRLSLQIQISAITGITRSVLSGDNPLSYTVHVRMSWAAYRRTTRLEDEAYCLMGLFGINMPLLYGEGPRAFRRLQEEIMRVTEDYTLLAWSNKRSLQISADELAAPSSGLLAASPLDFAMFHLGSLLDSPITDPVWQRAHPPISDAVVSKCKREGSYTHCFRALEPPADHLPPYLTSRGMRISLPLFQLSKTSYLACLTMTRGGNEEFLLCLELSKSLGNEEHFFRIAWSRLLVLSMQSRSAFKYHSIYVVQPPPNTIRRMLAFNVYERPTSLLILRMDNDTAQNLKHIFSEMSNLQDILTAIVSTEKGSFLKSYVTINDQGQEIMKSLPRDLERKFGSISPENLESLTTGSPSSCYVPDWRYSVRSPPRITLFFEDCDPGISIICTLGSAPSCRIEKLSNKGELLRKPAETQLRSSDRRSIIVNQPRLDKDISAIFRINVGIRLLGSTNNQKDFDRYEISITRERPSDLQSATKMMMNDMGI